MPFADDGGLISDRLEDLGESLLLPVEEVPIAEEAVAVAVLARENGGPAGAADRVANEGTIETHAGVGNTVDVRCLVDLGTVGADRLIGVIIGEDEDEVRALGGRRDCADGGQGDEND